mmetsp:Transcript_6057/g.18278  ORF Transcript_6057/g.18278 Transcript_6057/m.18278 type:complete len:200 (+) Transcript_6057:172-771(+)
MYTGGSLGAAALLENSAAAVGHRRRVQEEEAPAEDQAPRRACCVLLAVHLVPAGQVGIHGHLPEASPGHLSHDRGGEVSGELKPGSAGTVFCRDLRPGSCLPFFFFFSACGHRVLTPGICVPTGHRPKPAPRAKSADFHPLQQRSKDRPFRRQGPRTYGTVHHRQRVAFTGPGPCFSGVWTPWTLCPSRFGRPCTCVSF